VWVFSHPYYGETQKLEELKRTEDDWRLILAKRHAKRPTNAKGSGSTAASQREADGAAADGEEEEEEEDALTALLNGKRQREEDDETTREQVHEEMALRMDTGVRVNKALQSVLR